MGMNLCRRRIELCSDPTALNRRDLALTCAHHTSECTRRAAALIALILAEDDFATPTSPATTPGRAKDDDAAAERKCTRPTQTSWDTRSQVAGRRAAGCATAWCSSHGPHAVTM
jgi:hypothetical protein